MEIVEKYFPDLTEVQRRQFDALEDLYADWNAKINVISRKDFQNFATHHVLHSLGIAKVLHGAASSMPRGGACLGGADCAPSRLTTATRVLDVGTGGGFPTIPLAILYPDVHFTAVDSIAKKIRVVEGVVEGLGLKNVTPICTRVEGLKGKFDCVISRAVTQMPVFVGWVWGKLNPGGAIAALKGGDLTDELASTKLKWEVFPLRDYFEEEFFETKQVVYAKK